MATSIHLHMGIIGDGPFGCILMVTFIASYSLKMIYGQIISKTWKKIGHKSFQELHNNRSLEMLTNDDDDDDDDNDDRSSLQNVTLFLSTH